MGGGKYLLPHHTSKIEAVPGIHQLEKTKHFVYLAQLGQKLIEAKMQTLNANGLVLGASTGMPSSMEYDFAHAHKSIVVFVSCQQDNPHTS